MSTPKKNVVSVESKAFEKYVGFLTSKEKKEFKDKIAKEYNEKLLKLQDKHASEVKKLNEKIEDLELTIKEWNEQKKVFERIMDLLNRLLYIGNTAEALNNLKEDLDLLYKVDKGFKNLKGILDEIEHGIH